MQNSRLKNSIILRGMSSNIVDEAIVILKPNIKLKTKELSKNMKVQERKTEKNLVLQEAEHVILEYIEKINQKQNVNKNIYLEKKIKLLKIFNIILIVSFILVLFK